MLALFLIGWLSIRGSCGEQVSTAPATNEKLSRHEFVETHMGSAFKLILYSTSDAVARDASRAAFRRIAELDAILSDYQAESELSRFGNVAGGPPVRVGDDLFDVLERSKRLWERSDGAFDITIAPVGRLWRRARRERKLPDHDLQQKALGLVGSDRLLLDPASKTARLAVPGMRVDVGGMAKGHASQAALNVLKSSGIGRALVAGAGDIVVGDPPPDARGWKVGIAPLDPSTRDPEQFLFLTNAAVSTSGDAERFVVIDGHRYSHIVNPKTGIGVERRASVTVVADDGGTADALATAVYILGPERGLDLVESIPGAAVDYVQQTAKGVETHLSPRFRTLLERQ